MGENFNYVVTAQKPTCVSHSLAGNFTSPTDRNLIIGKCTLIEIHKITEEGVLPIVELPIYGRIASMEIFRPPSEKQDYLVLVTESFDTCILKYNNEKGELETVAAGSVEEHIERATENGIFTIVDPLCRAVALHLYEGSLKIIPLNFNNAQKYQTTEAFNVRLEELEILDIRFLETGNELQPVIAVLYEDLKRARHVKTYGISMKDKELVKGPWEQPNVGNGANILIAVPPPIGGVVIAGDSTITYHDGSSFTSTPLSTPSLFRSYEKIDSLRYLLGDSDGNLYILQLKTQQTNPSKISALSLDKLGVTSIPSSITYIDNGYTFIGSTYGDSQLIRLQDSKDEDGNLFEVFSTYTNLGAIVDFCVVDLEKQGQDQIVTCSGGFKDSTLRIIRNGIGIEEIASIELPGIKNLWSISDSSGFEKYLVLTFMGATRVMGFDQEDELGSVEIPGIDTTKQTIECQVVSNNSFVQVTDKSIRLIDTESLQLLSEWNLSEGTIQHTSISSSQVVISTAGAKIVYFEIENKQIKMIKDATLDNEISCIGIHSAGDDSKSSLIAAGMWTDYSIRLITLPDLIQITHYKLPVEVLPRSVLFSTFEGINYLLCGLGDGHLFSFHINFENGDLTESKKVSIGTKPISLTPFKSKDGVKHVFASSDRPTVIYSNNQKLLYSNVNLKDVTNMCPFNSQPFPDCIAVAKEDSLLIGSIDEIQKLHIRTVNLHEQALRICYYESAQVFIVSATRFTEDRAGLESQTHVLLLIDSQTFEKVHEFQLDANEMALSLVTTNFDGDKEYLVVGTGVILEEEQQAKKGRILVFDVRQEESSKQFSLVYERDTRGATNALSKFNKGKVLAGVNGSLQLFKWNETDDRSKELALECAVRNRILTVSIQSIGDFILTGDVMKSINVFNYKQLEMLEEIARDNNFYWMAATEIIDQDTYIGSENEYNLFTLQRNSESDNDETRKTLQVVGRYHIGDLVTKFRHGSLVMNVSANSSNDDDDVVMSERKKEKSVQVNNSNSPERIAHSSRIPTLLYATVSGAIGVVAQIPKETFEYFAMVQEAMNRVVKGVGGFKHEEFRAFKNTCKKEPALNFLDGDLIEQFLDLKREKQEQVSVELRKLTKNDDLSTIDEIVRRIEELSIQLH